MRLGKLLNNKSSASQYQKLSYAQSGEDLIIKFILDIISIEKPSYIDIGAHHPFYLSNTALFYESGCRGINIEPDPTLFNQFLHARKTDVNLNIGIASRQEKKDFYVMSIPTMNTFSRAEAERLVAEHNFQITNVLSIPIDTVSGVVQKYCKGVFPDFLSLDVEGLDEEILQSINFSASRPTVICLETISYSDNGTGVKNTNIIQFLKDKGYMVYADTYINTIFVEEKKWRKEA